MTDSKPYCTPCLSGAKMSRFTGEVLSNPSEYRQIVGALQYATLTRLDIAYSVNQLCQHMHAPTSIHWTAAKRVFHYLKGTIDSSLSYTKGPLTLTSFCDSDWAVNPDDRRSTTGFGIFFGPNLISWSAEKQHVVSRSSTEAKYRAMALTTADLNWLRMLFRKLQIPLPSPPTIWCDKSEALSLATNPVSHARTKHIEVDVHFIREKVTNRNIQLRYLSTLEQLPIFSPEASLLIGSASCVTNFRSFLPSVCGGVLRIAAYPNSLQPPLQHTNPTLQLQPLLETANKP